jgi:UTP--glucose-1-phosphate uridylyltransferase
MKQPTKAIIPAAGFGTRFLPQTKAMPKEMMPLIDKPIIQYVVEELVEAGIISFGIAFVCGKKRVPNPAAGIIALVGCFMILLQCF